ncbi:MAG TPA: hypothetical protein DHV85_22290, partial [Candidatus Accumulibacter sp.]|nr:hypothetical protein [Accumulibacter sp.]
LWQNVDGIDNHHVLFSANPLLVGVFTRLGETMLPLTYPVDELTPILNALEAEPPAQIATTELPREAAGGDGQESAASPARKWRIGG